MLKFKNRKKDKKSGDDANPQFSFSKTEKEILEEILKNHEEQSKPSYFDWLFESSEQMAQALYYDGIEELKINIKSEQLEDYKNNDAKKYNKIQKFVSQQSEQKDALIN